MSRFHKATKTKAKARVALVGPSGSGKTYTALLLARGLVGDGGTIAVIDTERASASKYADDVTAFDALDLDHHSPGEYVDAIKDAAREGYDCLVIDSLSHAWNGRGGALEMVDNAAKRSRDNSYVAWRDVTPQHNALVDAILTYPGHVVVTMRAKTEYVLETGKNGKQAPRKVGMAPIQRDGMEYEFDVVGDMDLDHNLMISKSRCSALADAVISKPGARVAETLRAWLSDGADAPKPAAALAPAPAPAPHPAVAELREHFGALKQVETSEDLHAWTRDAAPLLVAVDGVTREKATSAIIRAGDPLGVEASQVLAWVARYGAETEAAQ